MPMESIKSSMQFRDVKATNMRSTDSAMTVNKADANQAAAFVETSNSVQFEDARNEETYIDERRIKSAVKHVNSQMKFAKTRCEFSYHEGTKRVSIRVIDKDTDEVIREIPPEETL